MADTFAKVWREVRLHCPAAPPFLCQAFVRQAYRSLCDSGSWSWLRSEAEILTSAAKSDGTVTVTRSSAAVVGAGTAFAATDVGRQFRVTGGPIYTISTYTDATHITLDRVYGGTTAAGATYSILDAYVTMPEDFGHFVVVYDVTSGFQLRYSRSEDWLDMVDPQRSSSGDPTDLVSQRLSDAGRVRYELWPYTTTARNYPYLYMRRPEDLVDTTTFRGVLANRGDVLVAGALWKAAEYPGTADMKNPYFNLALAANKKREFDSLRDRIEVLDQETYLTWLEQVNRMNRSPLAGGADFAQSHDMFGMLYGVNGVDWY